MASNTMDLTDVESFSFLFKSIWEKETDIKCHCNIPDTILFKDGKPIRWLFTSESNGVSRSGIL